LSFDASFVRPKPFCGSRENPVIIQEVIESGTFFDKTFVFDPLQRKSLDKNKIR
jgi:hypothetical protein